MKIRRRKKGLILVLCIVMLLSGCQIAGEKVVFTTGLGSKDAFRIGDRVCTIAQAKVYLCNYQNIYGAAYGLNLWETKAGSGQLTTYVKDMTISELARIISMDELAAEQKVTLTEDEKKDAKDAAKTYYSSLSEDEVTYMGVTQDIIQSMYEDYALADKLYHSLTEGVNEEVSDDEARIMHAQQIVVTSKDTADQIAARLANGDDFSSLASEYNEAADIEVTLGRGDVPKEVEDVVFSMEDDQVSGCITAQNGYYFVKCVNKYDEELTQENKISIAQEREKTAFNDAYDAFVASQDSMMNYKAWDALALETDGTIKTDSFFSCYEQYFN